MLFETIAFEDGRPERLDYHQERMNQGMRDYFGKSDNPFQLSTLLECPPGYLAGKVKCRMDYHPAGYQIAFERYTIRPIQSLRLVKDNHIRYEYKFVDRKALQKCLAAKGTADEVIIVRKGLITDSSFANLVFRCPDGSLVTPEFPLLKGTMRQFYIDNKIVLPAEIHKGNLRDFTHVTLINSMRKLESTEWIPIESIYF